MSSQEPIHHLYIHVPYCDGKCYYCAFYSEQGSDPAYGELPGVELELLQASGLKLELETLYFGGGTPVMLREEGLGRLIRELESRVPLSRVYEWSVEVTPQLMSVTLASALRGYGVNRISMGVQCFDDQVLAAMGRRHSVADTLAALGAIKSAGFENVGIDLIAGLPGVDEDGWRESLLRAVALDVTHISVYALMVDEGSVLADMVRRGVTLPNDEEQLCQLAVAEEILTAAGYGRYEISNYARPGYECRHNLAYWHGNDYVGLGPAAASRIGRQRRNNMASVAAYGAALGRGVLPPVEEETVTVDDDLTERFVFKLRLAEGCNIGEFLRKYPQAGHLAKRWGERLKRLRGSGVVMEGEDGGWRLTRRGCEVADTVCGEMYV
ncbi:MAG: radical SAM family heme chaperone HemW [Lentisphaerae bacterium]|jgi:oxygen-independent coproporphyrinogen-3 oxidase|nr:radical SAM family heme chaperone HemW [Lentisphaerota bacterium]